MRSYLLHGFVKSAVGPETLGLLAGGALGFGLSSGTPISRLSMAALGAGLGAGVGSGIRGLVEVPDFAGLTDGEKAVLLEEMEQQARRRNWYRGLAAAGGIASAIAMESPLPLLAALPAATIAPYAQENDSLTRASRRFRAARRSS